MSGRRVEDINPSRRAKPAYIVRPPTALLTRGFDPALSIGSARPAVFRSSTYVFSSPENAERAFNVSISVGVEDWRDLLHEFRKALDGVRV
jgi:cystathionine beta-lyase/cystathionine gamma-synthase